MIQERRIVDRTMQLYQFLAFVKYEPIIIDFCPR